MAQKILVTGGTGYIGSHTVVELQKKGFEVIIIDDLSNSRQQVIAQIEKITGIAPAFFKINLCDHNKLRSFFNSHNDIQGVIHFAALKAVGESVRFPLVYYNNNLIALINLLDSLAILRCNKIVFSSSCTVYGDPDTLPVKEDSPVKKATSPYSNTKQICEEIIEDVAKITPLRSIILRYFNPIGAHESGLIGELPIGKPNNLIPFLTQVAIGKQKTLDVFGNDYDTHDGTCIRDYIHIVDLAKAHVLALQRLINNNNDSRIETFNLGTGKGYSVMDVINTFEKTNNIKVAYNIAPRRPGDVPSVYANADKAKEKLGWEATLPLEEMLKSAWAWEKNLNDGILRK
jgi:UDP-glucose 4-epimerase